MVTAGGSVRQVSPESLGPTLVIGEILVEIMASTRGQGFLSPLPLTGPYASGAPAIFIDQCAKIGGRAAMIGAVGADDFGTMVRERLARDGVDILAVAVLPDYPTGTAFVRYREDGSRDFVFNIARSAAGQIRLTPAAEAVIGTAGHLHVMGSALGIPYLEAPLTAALQALAARGGSLSLDPNLRKELMGPATLSWLEKLLPRTDILLPSGDELLLVGGARTEAEALATLFQRGIAEIVLKRGDRGATAFLASGERIEAPAFVVAERDPTGAGDCFGGAYVALRRQGESVATALRFASAAGARNVTLEGPMEGAGTRAELGDFITATPVRP